MGTLLADPLSILLVEDNPGDVELVREYLSSTQLGPHELRVAGTLGEACDQLRQARPDVVFLDLRLPDAAGPDVVSRVRSAAGDVPIVVLTGQSADEETAAECLRAGAQGYQSKNDLTADVLLHQLGRALALAGDDSGETTRLLSSVVGSAREALQAPGVPEGLRRALARLLASPDEGTLAQQAATRVEKSRPATRRRSTTAILRRQGELIASSPAMLAILDTCKRVAPTSARVLLLGETGTGKELLARALHRDSGRSGAFVAVNCAAVPATLIESELFGHERGAFTGAVERKRGLFALADGGTLFLDEVSELPLAAQASTLRVLQEGLVRPVGGGQELPVDVRVISATSTQLDQAVREGRFREDLLYRLDVIRIVVPPLRERRQDVVPLFRHYATRLAHQHGLPEPELEEGFLLALTGFDWPGNVRQLLNFVERVLLTHDGPLDEAAARALLGARGRAGGAAPPCAPPPAPDPLQPMQAYLDEAERVYLESVLRSHGGGLSPTAAAAGISGRTLLRKLKKHGLDRRDFRGRAR